MNYQSMILLQKEIILDLNALNFMLGLKPCIRRIVLVGLEAIILSPILIIIGLLL